MKGSTRRIQRQDIDIAIAVALNQPRGNPGVVAPKPIPLAVVAVNAAGTFRLALEPKIIPAGFIKNKLEFPPVT